MKTNHFLTISELNPTNEGKGGKAGYFEITNTTFVAGIFPDTPSGAFAAICSKPGDPSVGGWMATLADDSVVHLSSDNNNYINCSSFIHDVDGSFKARKSQFAACHFLMLDDIGTKVSFDLLTDFELSWLIETSPGNHQGGIILAEPITDGNVAIQLLDALINAGLCDKGASGPLSRWARLPVAINGKPKYVTESGESFKCRLVEWQLDKRYTPEEIIKLLKLEITPTRLSKKASTTSPTHGLSIDSDDDDVLMPKAAENPVISVLKARGLYKTPLGSGKHDITCPWLLEHTDELDTGSAYFEPDDTYPLGGFCCQHSHGGKLHIRELLEYLGVPQVDARHKSVIKIIPGDLHRVIEVAEKELAALGKHYQAGGLIVSVSTDTSTGDPTVIPTSSQALTKELSAAAIWKKYDGRAKDWMRCDPPARHVSILYDAQTFRHMSPLSGLARQPYFREIDGELVTNPGYDKASKIFGVFDVRQFNIPEPTLEAAKDALKLLEELLTEFHFVAGNDKAATLSAILTAVVRPTLAYAPGFHVKAPVFGSGKTYLCELIGSFAGPAGNTKVSYPTTSEEATKAILSLLLTNPAVIEFDDMDTDWIPHGVIKRMFTSDKISDRILGVSKTATVSTRTLFLGSGNNVGPIRDLLRRVLTIHIDPRCATPATIAYKGFPVDKVRNDRGRYVAAVLTIILAWKSAGSPRTKAESIVTFGGAWSDYCRYPLMWLGLPDPTTALLEQVKQDPDGDALCGLMKEWRLAFGSVPTTLRKAVDKAEFERSDLFDALREFPVDDRGTINRSKLGWLLKKNANRIVNGLEFQQSTADGRVAWRVALISTPPLTPLTALLISELETVKKEGSIAMLE